MKRDVVRLDTKMCPMIPEPHSAIRIRIFESDKRSRLRIGIVVPAVFV